MTRFMYDAYDEEGVLLGTGIVEAETDYDAQVDLSALYPGAFFVLLEGETR